MIPNIALIDKFADELHWAVTINFFSIKELKSVGKSIDWPYSFFKSVWSFLAAEAFLLYMQMQFEPDFASDRTIARASWPVEPVIIAVLPLISIFWIY